MSEQQKKSLKNISVLLALLIFILPFQNCMKFQSKNYSLDQSSFNGSLNTPNTPTSETNKSCILDGQTVLNGAGIMAYSVQVAPFGKTCLSNEYSRYRLCNNGVFTGTADSINFNFSSCSEDNNPNYVFNIIPTNQTVAIKPKALSILSTYSFQYDPNMKDYVRPSEYKIYKNGKLYFEHSNGYGPSQYGDGSGNHPYRYGIVLSEGNYSLVYKNTHSTPIAFGLFDINKFYDKYPTCTKCADDTTSFRDPRYNIYGYPEEAIKYKDMNSGESLTTNFYVNPNDLNFKQKDPGAPDSNYNKLLKINFIRNNKIVIEPISVQEGYIGPSYYQHLQINQTQDITYRLSSDPSIYARIRIQIGGCGTDTGSITVLEDKGLSVSEDLVSLSKGCVSSNDAYPYTGTTSYYYPVLKANVEYKMIDNVK